MARILAVGSSKWSDHRRATAALRRVMACYRDPYVLVCDMSDGAARYAAAAAQRLGWQVEAYELDLSKCAPDCPIRNHRRPGGPTGDWCPTARWRNTELILDTGVDLCLALVRPGHRHDQGTRSGQGQAKRRNVGVWTVEQKGGDSSGDQTG